MNEVNLNLNDINCINCGKHKLSQGISFFIPSTNDCVKERRVYCVRCLLELLDAQLDNFSDKRIDMRGLRRLEDKENEIV